MAGMQFNILGRPRWKILAFWNRAEWTSTRCGRIAWVAEVVGRMVVIDFFVDGFVDWSMNEKVQVQRRSRQRFDSNSLFPPRHESSAERGRLPPG